MSDSATVLPSITDGQLGFDPEALRARYRAERDKRIRSDGNDQYVEVKGDFSRYVDDPYVEPGFTREPLTDEVGVLVIGGGSAVFWPPRGCARQESTTSALSKKVATSAAPGTGTAILALSAISGGDQAEELVGDGWTDIFRNLGGLLPSKIGAGLSPKERANLIERSDFKKMNEIRARIDRIVKDKMSAEALKPWYISASGPTFNDEYLPAFSNPNVTLVDTSAHSGVDRGS
jgi:hypothetical protein